MRPSRQVSSPRTEQSPRGFSWRTPLRVWLASLFASLALADQAFAAEPSSWWAFQPLRTSSPPTVRDDAWSRTPIDSFILKRLETAGLTPAPEASRAVLLRRLSFDLTGLPPTTAELERFEHDTSPDAWEREVERLLASPRYGERWGQHWLDVARYADTAGDNADYPVPEARYYRDYVIQAFNTDKPYRDFIVEQLAGDVLARRGPEAAYAERIAATGFLALSRRYATAPFELMHLTVEDAIETTGRAFLGMTFRCARCHDHKYDPVTTRDYYGLYGLFSSTRFPYAGSEEFQSKNLPRTGFVPLQPESQVRDIESANAVQVARLKAELKTLEAVAEAAKTNAAAPKPDTARLGVVRTELKRRDRFSAAPGIPVAYAVWESAPVDEAMHKRGEPADRGEVVPRCAPRWLGIDGTLSIPAGASGREAFANWLARPDHPLTARVLVNRIWHHHFGRGLVPTPSNFGLRSEPPSHPELLDYLVVRFLESGGSIKTLHRLILNSATWRQAWVSSPQAESTDPANTLHWRHDRRRLDAESIRDALMTAAGGLDLSWAPPHPFPRFEDWNWTQHTPFKAVYDTAHRSVYLMRQRIQRHPFLALFDAPDANVSSDLRTAATVPPQALYFMNNPFVAAQAAALARVIDAIPGTMSTRIDTVVRRVWNRPPGPDEIRRLTTYWERYRAARVDAGSPNAGLEAWTSLCRVLLSANEFVYVD